MTRRTQWLILSALFVWANVVAAGVMQIIARALMDFFPQEGAVVPIVYLAGFAGIATAVQFLRGATQDAMNVWKHYHRHRGSTPCPK